MGIAGYCANNNETINIRDAYADERFNRSVDLASGYVTRTVLTMPFSSCNTGNLIGVCQLLNKKRRAARLEHTRDALRHACAGLLVSRLAPFVCHARCALAGLSAALALHRPVGAPFNDEDEAMLEAILKVAGLVMENAQLAADYTALYKKMRDSRVPKK